MWFYAEKWYQKLPLCDRPLFSRVDAPLNVDEVLKKYGNSNGKKESWNWAELYLVTLIRLNLQAIKLLLWFKLMDMSEQLTRMIVLMKT